MSKVILIASRELQSFFTTWMGYIIAAMALVISGLLFVSFAVGEEPKFSADVLSDFFYFTSGIGMVACIFLSMRLFAEEIQTGTIKLFYTSPVSERQMVYGKFLSAFLFFMFLCVVSLYLPLLIKLSGKISFGHLASGYLGLLLLGAAVISMSLFASVLAPNQLIAGVLAAFFVVTMLILWMVAPIVEPPFRDLFHYLAIHNRHFNSFSRGIVHTRDVIYYLSVIFFFLECSIRTLEARRLKG